jgi:replicative DNA helicase
MFLHRQRETDKKPGEQENPNKANTELIIAKQRNGPVGTVEIMFLPQFTKFAPWTRDHR